MDEDGSRGVEEWVDGFRTLYGLGSGLSSQKRMHSHGWIDPSWPGATGSGRLEGGKKARHGGLSRV